jgi:hypothetical protein
MAKLYYQLLLLALRNIKIHTNRSVLEATSLFILNEMIPIQPCTMALLKNFKYAKLIFPITLFAIRLILAKSIHLAQMSFML